MVPLQIYRSVFESSPMGEYLLSRDFVIVDVNAAFLKACGRQREDLLGRTVFEAFPPSDDGGDDGVAALREALERTLATGQPSALPLQRYPIAVSQPDGSHAFEERYWSAVNTPVYGPGGELAFIAHSTIDVTALRDTLGQPSPDARLAQLQAGMLTRAQTLQEVNRALLAERSRLRHLFEHAPGFVYFTREPQHVIEQANNAFYDLVGARDVVGKTVHQAFPETAQQGFLALHDVVFRSGQPYIARAQRLLLYPGGGAAPVERYVDVVYQPIVDERGRVTGICGQGNDITEKMRVEAELRGNAERQAFQLELADRLRTLESPQEVVAEASEMLGLHLDAARVLYCEIDEAAGTITAWRDWVHPRHGLPSMAGQIRRLEDFGPAVAQTLRGGEPLRVDDVREHAGVDGHAPAYEAIGVRAKLAIPLVKSGRMLAILSVHHREPRHWTDDDVGKTQDTAERTWAAMEKARAQAELREAGRRKDEFLAMLAHELRNPLAPISAAARLMEIGRLDEARLRQTSQVISRQVSHMTGLVDDLLDVSRVTRGLVTLNKAPRDLKGLVSNAVEQVRPLMESQNHALAIELPTEPVYVTGDEKRLVQILTNLLNNAAKYTPPRGHITLRMAATPQQVAIDVQDDGIGIPLELQQRVFDLFAQAERTPDRSQGGLGLGLALVKSLVELHGGKVACRSEGHGLGSTFTVRLPRLVPEGELERRNSKREVEMAASPLKILLVDDNEDAAEMLAILLETSGYAVTVEHRGLDGLARARELLPDICLLDIGLPDMDGKDLARRLREAPETSHAVLIAVTGYGQEQDRRSAMAAGFDHHLVKPVDPARLTSLLNEVALS